MASEKVSRKMVLEIKYVNANNAVIHTENLVTGILAKISLGTGIWAKFRLGTGIWYPPSRTSHIQLREIRGRRDIPASLIEEGSFNYRCCTVLLVLKNSVSNLTNLYLKILRIQTLT